MLEIIRAKDEHVGKVQEGYTPEYGGETLDVLEMATGC